MENFVGTIGKGLEYETEKVNKRIRSPFNIPLFIPTPENMRRRHTIKEMYQVVEKIMQEDQEGKPENILSKLIKAGEINPRQIRDEVMTLLLAGHETTSNNLMWTTWFLARFPEWQFAILDELKEFGKKAQDLVREDLPKLKVLRSVLQESLRLMPPAPVIARNNIEEDIIGGYYVPKDTTVVCQQWVTQRDERFWPDPLTYKPERFIDRVDKRDDYSFFPFARGPRACIGEEMAMVEASFILASFVERFAWSLKEGFEPQPVHNLTLQSRNGMWLELSSRN
jgi:cytochrome P450